MRKRISDFGFRISGELAAAASTYGRRGIPEILVRLPELATAGKSPEIRNPKSEILLKL